MSKKRGGYDELNLNCRAPLQSTIINKVHVHSQDDLTKFENRRLKGLDQFTRTQSMTSLDAAVIQCDICDINGLPDCSHTDVSTLNEFARKSGSQATLTSIDQDNEDNAEHPLECPNPFYEPPPSANPSDVDEESSLKPAKRSRDNDEGETSCSIGNTVKVAKLKKNNLILRLKSATKSRIGSLQDIPLPESNTLENDIDLSSIPLPGEFIEKPSDFTTKRACGDMLSVQGEGLSTSRSSLDSNMSTLSSSGLTPPRKAGYMDFLSSRKADTRQMLFKKRKNEEYSPVPFNTGNTSYQETRLALSGGRKMANTPGSYDIGQGLNCRFYTYEDLITYESKIGFVDTHCHIDFMLSKYRYKKSFAQYKLDNADTFPISYKGCVAVYCNPDSFDKEYQWGEIAAMDDVKLTFGCHPHMAHMWNQDYKQKMNIALRHSQVVALGEIGLDYSEKNKVDHDQQKAVFREQLRMARQRHMPLVIHCREAHEDILEILNAELSNDHKIHRHCFTETIKTAEEWLETFPNTYIGFTPLVTYQHAKSVQHAAAVIPLDKILLETDAPFFPPNQYRKQDNKLCHPGMAIHVAAQIASLRRDVPDLETVLKHARDNTRYMYGF